MSNCRPDIVTPGTPTSSGGRTSALSARAIRCDQARLLYRLQGGTGQCFPSSGSNRPALYASVLEQDAATQCGQGQNTVPNGSTLGPTGVSNKTSVSVLRTQMDFPRVGVPASIITEDIQQQVLLASVNQFNPDTRFAMYARNIPLARGVVPCPVRPIPPIVYNNSIAVGEGFNANSSVEGSIDGFTWTPSISGGFTSPAGTFIGYGIAYNGSMWVAVGEGVTRQGSILYSDDGSNWFPVLSGGFICNLGIGPSILNIYIGYAVAWTGSYWIAVGQSTTQLGSFQKSYDGVYWSTIHTTSGFIGPVYGIATNTNAFVAVGTGTNSFTSIQQSSDGITWRSTSTGGFDSGIGNGVAWNGYTWVAVGNASTPTSTIQQSLDGFIWVPVSSGGFDGGVGYGIANNGYYWVAVGSSTNPLATIQRSITQDASTWQSITSGGFTGGQGYGIAWSSTLGIWIAVGSGSDANTSIQISYDGLVWTPSTVNLFESRNVYGVSCGLLTTSVLPPSPRSSTLLRYHTIYPKGVFLYYTGGEFATSWSVLVNGVRQDSYIVTPGTIPIQGIGIISIVDPTDTNQNGGFMYSATTIQVIAINTGGETLSNVFSLTTSYVLNTGINGSSPGGLRCVYSPGAVSGIYYLAIPPFDDTQLGLNFNGVGTFAVYAVVDYVQYYVTLQHLFDATGFTYAQRLRTASFISYSNTFGAATFIDNIPVTVYNPLQSYIYLSILTSPNILLDSIICDYSAPGAVGFTLTGTDPANLRMNFPNFINFTIGDLYPGTTYTFTLIPIYASGYRGQSNPLTITTLSPVITFSSATTTTLVFSYISNGFINLVVGNLPSGGSVEFDSPFQGYFTISGLIPAVAYTVTMYGDINTYTNIPSNSLVRSTLAPVITFSSATTTTLEFSYVANGLTNIVIENVPSGGTAVLDSPSPGYFTISGLNPGVAYTVTLYGTIGIYTNIPSNSLIETTTGIVISLNYASYDFVVLNYTANGFVITAVEGGEASSQVVLDNPSAGLCTITNLLPTTSYTLRLAGTYNSEYTGYSNQITTSTVSPSINLISNITNLVFGYSAPGGVFYTITGVDDPAGQFQFNTPSPGTFTVIGLSLGISYTITLVVTYPSGAIAPSNPVTASLQPPSPVTITNQIGEAYTSITVSFSGTAVDNFYSYVWYTLIDFEYYYGGQPSSPYIFTYEGLSEGQAHYIQMFGYNPSTGQYVESNIFQGYTIY